MLEDKGGVGVIETQAILDHSWIENASCGEAYLSQSSYIIGHILFTTPFGNFQSWNGVTNNNPLSVQGYHDIQHSASK